VKPTYGRVSRYGLVAFASGLDQIGPIARTVEDAAILLGVICGFDPLDSTSAEIGVPDFLSRLHEPVEGLRIGVPAAARSESNHPAVNEAVERAIGMYREAGAQIVDVDLPHMDHGIAAYYIISPAEASSNLARFDGVRYGRRAELKSGDGLDDLYRRSRAEGFGPEVQRRIMLGTHVLSAGYYDAYYNTALKVRRLIKQDYDAAFKDEGGGCHALLMPAAPTPAFRLGEKRDDPLALYLEDAYTVGANLTGLPAVSVPVLLAKEGEPAVRLPVGVQLIGPALGEAVLLRIARALEAAAALDAGPLPA
jgi:aspartyl-tRNA(Asn)/glutamyl-tRNA(Gln) amidotransferase subunit A